MVPQLLARTSKPSLARKQSSPLETDQQYGPQKPFPTPSWGIQPGHVN